MSVLVGAGIGAAVGGALHLYFRNEANLDERYRNYAGSQDMRMSSYVVPLVCTGVGALGGKYYDIATYDFSGAFQNSAYQETLTVQAADASQALGIIDSEVLMDDSMAQSIDLG